MSPGWNESGIEPTLVWKGLERLQVSRGTQGPCRIRRRALHGGRASCDKHRTDFRTGGNRTGCFDRTRHWPQSQVLALIFLKKHPPVPVAFTSWFTRSGRDGGNICHVLVAGGSLRKIPGRDFTNRSHHLATVVVRMDGPERKTKRGIFLFAAFRRSLCQSFFL